MNAAGSNASAARPCLLITGDPVLRADVLRVAAAADCAVQERDLPVGRFDAQSSTVRLEWEDACVVLLDVATAGQAAGLPLPRRDGVVVLATGDASVDHWRSATAIGATHVLELPRDDEALIVLLAAEPDAESGGGGVIAVVGARGGGGASTFSAALALSAAATDTRTLLVDGDEYGAGLDLLLGWERDPGLRWSGLVVEAGRISGESLRGALPSRGALSVLSADRVTQGSRVGGVDSVAATAVVDAGRRAGDLVVCDVPRLPGPHTDAFHDSADLVVLLVPAEIGAVAAAENIAGYLGTRNSNVGLVVRGPSPGGLGGPEIARALELPLLTTMRPEPSLAQRVERGGLQFGRRSPLRSAAAAVLETFARKPRNGRAVA